MRISSELILRPDIVSNSTQLISTVNYGRRCVDVYVRIYFQRLNTTNNKRA